jgi:hypothetical protein
MKTNELSGAALDWAVATCEGYKKWDGECFTEYADGYPGAFFISDWNPSTNWAQGGAIIAREKLGMWFCDEVVDAETDVMVRGAAWYAETFEGEHGVTGQTALIAAMRCYVASKLGDDVNLPEGLQ